MTSDCAFHCRKQTSSWIKQGLESHRDITLMLCSLRGNREGSWCRAGTGQALNKDNPHRHGFTRPRMLPSWNVFRSSQWPCLSNWHFSTFFLMYKKETILKPYQKPGPEQSDVKAAAWAATSPARTLLPESALHGSWFGPKIQNCLQAWPTVPDEPSLSLQPWSCASEQRSCCSGSCACEWEGFLASGWKLRHLFPELPRIRESSFLHITPLFPKEKGKIQMSEQGKRKREARVMYMLLQYRNWGKNGLHKDQYHEMQQHCLLAAVGRGIFQLVPLATSPLLPAGAFLWMPFPFPKIWKGLNRVCELTGKKNKIWEWICETREKGNEQLLWRMSSASPGVPGTQARILLAMAKAAGQAVIAALRSGAVTASRWGSIICIYWSCMCLPGCRPS